jgi:ATP-binding cassette subfamily B protein
MLLVLSAGYNTKLFECGGNLSQGQFQLLAIDHRLSAIREADQVLVINDGRVIEHSNYEELLEQRGFYCNLYMSQFKGHQEVA